MLMMTDRPALHCPGQVQPVAGEPPWPAQSSHLAKTEGGYTLEKLYFIQVHISTMASSEYFPL